MISSAFSSKVSFYLLSLALLGACGGGGTTAPVEPTPAPTPEPESAQYRDLANTDDALSRLSGTLVGLDRNNPQNMSIVRGNLTHRLGDFNLIAPEADNMSIVGNVRSSAAISSEGTVVRLTDLQARYGVEPEYALEFEYASGNGEKTRSGVGFFGIAVSLDDIPTSGSATYTGGAQVQVVQVGSVTQAASSFDLGKGRSHIVVDFAMKRANVTLDAFADAKAAPINQVTLEDILISGDRFFGGDIKTSLNKTMVDVVGVERSNLVDGYLYGFDSATSKPDAAAGHFVSEGGTGLVSGSFLAD